MDFILTIRNKSGNGFGEGISSARYLIVPDGQEAVYDYKRGRAEWLEAVTAEAGIVRDADVKVVEKGHVLFFVHGYNTEQRELLARHRAIKTRLAAAGFPGTVVSFDWPSNGRTTDYVFDRRDARLSADRLYNDGIALLAKLQEPDCTVNVHVLAHSMGCFLVREAFDFADDDHDIAQTSWVVSQMVFAAADISRKSAARGNPKVASLLRHCTRLTNYYSRYDEVLSASEVKRIGVSRRLGRVGAPEDVDEKLVDLDCSDHYEDTYPEGDLRLSHNWYFKDDRFFEDLCQTLVSRRDRKVIGKRQPISGGLSLV
ncbi:MAG: alpha/beta fold hydrolase [Pseudomonadota bacterium]